MLNTKYMRRAVEEFKTEMNIIKEGKYDCVFASALYHWPIRWKYMKWKELQNYHKFRKSAKEFRKLVDNLRKVSF